MFYKAFFTVGNYFVERLVLSRQSHLMLISCRRQCIPRVCLSLWSCSASSPCKHTNNNQKTHTSQIKLYHHYTQREALWSLYFILVFKNKIYTYTLCAFRFSHAIFTWKNWVRLKCPFQKRKKKMWNKPFKFYKKVFIVSASSSIFMFCVVFLLKVLPLYYIRYILTFWIHFASGENISLSFYFAPFKSKKIILR